VFVAGQMPNNDDMTGIAKPAYRPPNAVWNGTDIRLQTEFLITSRLKPALEAGGSSLENAIKAQCYLTNINDLPEFLDVWNSHFGEHPCALTVVATKGLALLESISNLLRVNHFVSDLNVVPCALRRWQEKLAGAPIPFGAVRTPVPMPVPGCNIVADMWVYHP